MLALTPLPPSREMKIFFDLTYLPHFIANHFLMQWQNLRNFPGFSDFCSLQIICESLSCSAITVQFPCNHWYSRFQSWHCQKIMNTFSDELQTIEYQIVGFSCVVLTKCVKLFWFFEIISRRRPIKKKDLLSGRSQSCHDYCKATIYDEMSQLDFRENDTLVVKGIELDRKWVNKNDSHFLLFWTDDGPNLLSPKYQLEKKENHLKS